jgi:hypothetical protein
MTDLKPKAPIRRFDIFADYNRIKNEVSGLPEATAKGDAIWLAKVVAGRRFGAAVPAAAPGQPDGRPAANQDERGEDGFRSASGIPQTDRTFDRDIVERMGAEFYQRVFHPAIDQAFHEGKKYEEIRDTLRAQWK